MDEAVASILHTCPLCQIKFSSTTAFSLHFVEQHSNKIKKEKEFLVKKRTSLPNTLKKNEAFPCQFCSFVTKTEHLLSKHKENQHNPHRKIYSCHLCSYSCLQERTFHLHQMKHSQVEAKFACDQCGKLFLSMGIMKRHALTHSKSKIFNCDWQGCGKSFNIKSRLTDHIRSVHKSRTGNKLNKKNSYELHSLSDEDFRLNGPAEEGTHKALLKHGKAASEISTNEEMHKNLPMGVPQSIIDSCAVGNIPEIADTCETNSSLFENPCEFEKGKEDNDNTIVVYDVVLPHHKNTVNDSNFSSKRGEKEKSIRKTKSKKRDLKSSISNTRLSNFICSRPGCDKRFRDSYNLRMHLYTHTREMQRACKICGYSCVQKSALDKHMMRHRRAKWK